MSQLPLVKSWVYNGGDDFRLFFDGKYTYNASVLHAKKVNAAYEVAASVFVKKVLAFHDRAYKRQLKRMYNELHGSIGSKLDMAFKLRKSDAKDVRPESGGFVLLQCVSENGVPLEGYNPFDSTLFTISPTDTPNQVMFGQENKRNDQAKGNEWRLVNGVFSDEGGTVNHHADSNAAMMYNEMLEGEMSGELPPGETLKVKGYLEAARDQTTFKALRLDLIPENLLKEASLTSDDQLSGFDFDAAVQPFELRLHHADCKMHFTSIRHFFELIALCLYARERNPLISTQKKTRTKSGSDPPTEEVINADADADGDGDPVDVDADGDGDPVDADADADAAHKREIMKVKKEIELWKLKSQLAKLQRPELENEFLREIDKARAKPTINFQGTYGQKGSSKIDSSISHDDNKESPVMKSTNDAFDEKSTSSEGDERKGSSLRRTNSQNSLNMLCTETAQEFISDLSYAKWSKFADEILKVVNTKLGLNPKFLAEKISSKYVGSVSRRVWEKSWSGSAAFSLDFVDDTEPPSLYSSDDRQKAYEFLKQTENFTKGKCLILRAAFEPGDFDVDLPYEPVFVNMTDDDNHLVLGSTITPYILAIRAAAILLSKVAFGEKKTLPPASSAQGKSVPEGSRSKYIDDATLERINEMIQSSQTLLDKDKSVLLSKDISSLKADHYPILLQQQNILRLESTKSEKTQILERLNEYGFKYALDVYGDGNCYFRALYVIWKYYEDEYVENIGFTDNPDNIEKRSRYFDEQTMKDKPGHKILRLLVANAAEKDKDNVHLEEEKIDSIKKNGFYISWGIHAFLFDTEITGQSKVSEILPDFVENFQKKQSTFEEPNIKLFHINNVQDVTKVSDSNADLALAMVNQNHYIVLSKEEDFDTSGNKFNPIDSVINRTVKQAQEEIKEIPEYFNEQTIITDETQLKRTVECKPFDLFRYFKGLFKGIHYSNRKALHSGVYAVLFPEHDWFQLNFGVYSETNIGHPFLLRQVHGRNPVNRDGKTFMSRLYDLLVESDSTTRRLRGLVRPYIVLVRGPGDGALTTPMSVEKWTYASAELLLVEQEAIALLSHISRDTRKRKLNPKPTSLSQRFSNGSIRDFVDIETYIESISVEQRRKEAFASAMFRLIKALQAYNDIFQDSGKTQRDRVAMARFDSERFAAGHELLYRYFE